MYVKFNVFAAGTTNKLFTTTARGFVPPAIPCEAPSWVDWDWDVKFLGADDNTHSGIALKFYVECEGEGEFGEVDKSFLYMADTTEEGGAVWAQAWSWNGIAFDIGNWDNDEAEEVQVVLGREGDAGETGRVINTQ